MNTPRLFLATALPLLTGLSLSTSFTSAAETAPAPTLAENFQNPPLEYHPRAWWHWMNAKVTKDGITKDLEAMQRIGLKGAQIFNMGAHRAESNGTELILSDTWCAAVDHAAQESARLGLKLGTSGGEGCSGSGGQWVTPEQSMQELVWKTTHLTSTNTSPLRISKPRINGDYYQDIATYAFPSNSTDTLPLATHQPKVTSDIPNLDWAKAIDADLESFVEVPQAAKGTPHQHLTLEFPKPITVRSLSLDFFEEANIRQVKLYTSADGTNWKHACTAQHRRGHVPHGREELIEGFAARETRFVKIEFPAVHHQKPIKIYNLNLQAYRIPGIHPKAARMRGGLTMSAPSTVPVPANEIIATNKMIDLTPHLKADNTLDYQLPAGDWTIVRFGHTSKGNKSSPAAPQSAGLEVDKMDPAHIEKHFREGMLGQMADRLNKLGNLTGETFNCVNLDSWEAGCQTWTRHFPAKFQKKHGYDSRKWLLTLTGRVVGSLDQSDRFLWDYRQTVSDLIIDGYYKTLRRLCNEHGLRLEAEAPGTGIPIIIDGIKALGTLDIPQGEFWLGGKPHPVNGGWTAGGDNTKEPACAAHVYGKEIVSCEAFTAFGHHDGWTQTPYTLKPFADRQFCKGMNEIVFHCSAHQPDDRAPGVTLGQFGINFHRHLTWWEQSKAWIDYLSRCQYLLRQGRFHADVLYYYGEDSPNSASYFVPNALDPRKQMKPVLPQGYDYDVCDLTIFNQITVDQNNGDIILPSGMRYRYLVLPQHARYTPAALEKVHQLLQGGATLIGPKPTRSPSLANFPQADQKIKQLAEQIWSPDNKNGTGRIISGKDFETILAEDKLVQDFAFTSDQPDPQLHYIHRHLPNNEHLYFVSNQQERAENVTLTFRVTGLKPELWNPVTGQQSALTGFKDNGTTTTLTLPMSHYDSAFIAFKRERSRLATTLQRPAEDPKKQSEQSEPLQGPWQVTFQPKRGGPAQPVTFDKLDSLTNNADPAIKYFSGTVTYKKTIQLDPKQATTLDLGQVHHVAEVFLNGQALATLWKPPYTIDLPKTAKVGSNELEIRVTNVWKNRLIRDAQLPLEKRVTYSAYNFYPHKADQPETPLIESGLLGPVRLLNQ